MDSQEIRNQLKKMIELQTVELETGKLRSSLENVGKSLASLEREREIFENELKETQAHTTELKKAYKNYELDTQAHFSKISKSREKLQSVKTNKEYQSILKEIEDIEKKNSELEDLMLAHLDKIEASEAVLGEKTSDFALLEQDIKQRTQEIKEDEAQKHLSLNKLDDQLALISGEIQPDFMEKLKVVRNNVGILAVVPVVNAVCQGCYVNIPPQLFNELQRFDKLYYCLNCQRIIFWEEPDE